MSEDWASGGKNGSDDNNNIMDNGKVKLGFLDESSSSMEQRIVYLG